LGAGTGAGRYVSMIGEGLLHVLDDGGGGGGAKDPKLIRRKGHASTSIVS
jgi:hypothetical protein